MKATLLIVLALLLTSCANKKQDVMSPDRPTLVTLNGKRCGFVVGQPWLYRCHYPDGSCIEEDRRCRPYVLRLCWGGR